MARHSTPGNLIVPHPRHSKLPAHVLANNKPQPWELLPMRAAALKQYPDFFGQSALFFSSIHSAVLKGAATQLLRPSKVCSRSIGRAIHAVHWGLCAQPSALDCIICA